MSDEVTTSALGLDQLASALCAAQAQMGDVPKSAVNPAFKNAADPAKKNGTAYSTLADVIGAIRKPLTDNGLSFLQPVSRTEHGVSITTVLLHKSGQRYSSTLEMPCGSNASAQAVGSAISYGRRYSLLAMMGLASDDDDDGNAAVEAHRSAPRQQERRDEPRQQQRAPEATDEKALNEAIRRFTELVRGYLPEVSFADLVKQAGVSAPPTKLTSDQKQIVLKSLQQKLKTLEDTDPT